MLQANKIKSLNELSVLCQFFKKKGKKIIHCHGCFDLLHIGHIRYLHQAGEKGDILIVTVTPDKYVDKGPHRPAFNEALRAEAIASLDCVNFVGINKWPTAEKTIRLLKPDFYVKGSDFKNSASDITGKLAAEERVAREIGCELIFTKDIVFSSTNLINRFASNFSEEIQEYLEVFRTRYTLNDIIELLDKMSGLKVLVVGDAILDDYHYCRPIGASSKDSVLAVQYQNRDIFAGGAMAVANHVANFGCNVGLGTVLGTKNSHEKLIRKNLHEKIMPYFVFKDNAPTLIKKRFVDGYSFSKLFEVYIMDDSNLNGDVDNRFCEWLRNEAPGYDLVIAADFGHGAISEKAREILIKHAPFLAVNTQANSGNRGFHTISRYAKADYVSIAEHEIRLEKRDLKSRIKPLMDSVCSRMNYSTFVVTRGKKGCLIRSKEGDFLEAPAFAHKVVDRVGAGDAFLSITSLAARLEAPPEVIGFIGNVVGALAVEILGNEKSVEKKAVVKFVTSLLK